MDFLIGGIRNSLLEGKIRPVFEGLGYSGICYHLKPTQRESQELILSGQALDLMILSGWEDLKYTEFYNISVANPRIPSILLIANLHYACMDMFSNIHPPNWTAYFMEFERVTRERIDAFLAGDCLDWSLY